jgi:hypothetical protein
VPGGTWFVETLRDSVKAGLLQGSRIFCAGRALTPPGGIFDNRGPADGDLPEDATGVLCCTVEDFVTETRRQCEVIGASVPWPAGLDGSARLGVPGPG